MSELELRYSEKKTNAKRWIEDKDDLEALYQAFSSGDEITLWCDARHAPEEQKKRRKRKTEETDEKAWYKASRSSLSSIQRFAFVFFSKYPSSSSDSGGSLSSKVSINRSFNKSGELNHSRT